jgi:glutathione S-transferase
MFKLYARAGAGSAAVEALLAVSGLSYELINVPREPDRSITSWFRAINSRGEVPALQLPDGTIMTESAAMMIYLADLAEGLAPAVSASDRPAYLRWMVYLATAPYTSYLRMYYPARHSTDAAHAPSIKARAMADIDRDFDFLADDMQNMSHGPFILGKELSAVDIYAAMLIAWAPDIQVLTARQPVLGELYRAVSKIPVIRKVFDRNEMP